MKKEPVFFYLYLFLLIFVLKELEYQIPARQMYLDFHYRKSHFHDSINEAKVIVEQNRQKLASSDHAEEALQKHKVKKNIYFCQTFIHL